MDLYIALWTHLYLFAQINTIHSDETNVGIFYGIDDSLVAEIVIGVMNIPYEWSSAKAPYSKETERATS